MGQGIRVACAALDEIARRCASTAMIYLMHLSGCSCYIARPHAVEDTLQQVARGEHLTTLAWSEKGSRSHFGVVGESGHPGFETISCTLYISADADEQILKEIWQTTLARSPLVNTLDRCVGLTLSLRAVE